MLNRIWHVLLYILMIPLLWGQEDDKENFLFRSVEEEVLLLINEANSLKNTDPLLQITLATEAYELSKTKELFESQVRSLITMAGAYFNLRDFEKSFEILNESKILSDKINYIEGLSSSFFELGLLQNYLENYEKSIINFIEAKKLVSNDDVLTVVNVNYGLAKAYKNKKEYLKAINLIETIIERSNELENKVLFLDLILLAGEAQFLSGDIVNSIENFNRILKNTSDLGEFELKRAKAMSFLGKSYALMGQYNLALSNGQRALLLSAKNNSDEARIDAYESLAYVYGLMDNYKLAYRNLQFFYDLREKINKEKNKSNFNKIKAYYNRYDKERDIDNQVQVISTLKKYIVFAFAFLGFLILSIFMYFIYLKFFSKDLGSIHFGKKDDSIQSPFINKRRFMSILKLSLKESNHKSDSLALILIVLSLRGEHINSIRSHTNRECLNSLIYKIKYTQNLPLVFTIWKGSQILIHLSHDQLGNLDDILNRLGHIIENEHYFINGLQYSFDYKYSSVICQGDKNSSECLKRCQTELLKD